MRRALLGLVAAALAAATGACAGHGTPVVPLGASAPQTSATTAGVGGMRPAASLSVPTGWSATATLPLALSGASDLGAVPSSQSITVRIGLQLNDVAGLKSALASRQKISPAQFVSTYAPTSAQVAQVESYLESQGLSAIAVERNHLVISATGSAAQIEKAFDTKLEAYSLNGATVYANGTAAYVPASLGKIVVAVLGLNDVQSLRVTPHRAGVASASPAPTAPPGTPESPCTLYGLEILAFPTPLPEPASSQVGCLRNYAPADYWRAYDVGSTPTGSGATIAVMTIGGLGTAVSDFRVNEQGDGIPQVPVAVEQIGLAGSPPVTSGPDEWTLDMTASSGMAGQVAQIVLYNTTSFSDSDVVLMFNRWAEDDTAQIGNSSFGGCEAFEYLDGAMALADEIFLQAAAQGQTMFASAGDTGSFCPVGVGQNGVPAGAPMVNWPAASPYVTAVGGTTLLTDNYGNYQGETPWYSGGGGLSQFEYAPYWEAQAQPVASQGESFRGVPDIAMDGDLQTGMIIYLSSASGWTVIGGTSLSSPLAAGVWARMLQSDPALGFAPPALYANFSSHAAGAQQTGPPPWQPDGGFHDIIVGANGLYTALPGYDYTTGLGSFDVHVLASQI